MGLMKRFSYIFKSKASKALDKYEDPRETLDYSYEKQLELLQKMRRGVADVATSRKRIELQAQQLQTAAAKLEGQAKQAVAQNREDLAREALGRRAGIADLSVGGDRLQAELNRTDSDSQVELELARLKGELGGTETKQLGTGTPTPTPTEEQR